MTQWKTVAILTWMALTSTQSQSIVVAAQAVPEQPACAGIELKQANAALVDARKALDEIITALNSPKADDVRRLETWFGVNSSAGATKIKRTFESARGFAKGVTFRCSASTNMKIGDVYAYVRPNKSFAVVLGSFFFTAGESGFDSKLGTIIHELTHFVLVGATKDNAYGVAGARKLAISKPAAAQENADNFQYFVEATIFKLR